jgi:hypothetical protein
MMCDEAVPTAYVENIGVRRQYSGNLERHVICSSNLAAPAHAFEASFDGGD